METQTLSSKIFSEAARFKTSVVAEILMRESPELEKVFKLLNQLYNEKAGILRDMVTNREDRESLWMLEGQMDDIEFDLSTVGNHLKEIINSKNN